ncbi:MAG: hypothetical protein KBT03_11030 [Bacteroidales bacterium]|nr:hypothetical protein [Candidatus Scybalousia scybalohippi]
MATTSYNFTPGIDEDGKQMYYAEIQVNQDFNLYIKRSIPARGMIYEKTSLEHEYAISSLSNTINWGGRVIGNDIISRIYPKFYKIVSYSPVDECEITTN